MPVGAAVTGAAASTAALSEAQKTLEASSLGLASAAQVENTALGRQAVILNAATAATEANTAAMTAAAGAAGTAAGPTGRLAASQAALASATQVAAAGLVKEEVLLPSVAAAAQKVGAETIIAAEATGVLASAQSAADIAARKLVF